MKMVKKILLGMVATAAILSLASCGKREEAGNSEMINVDAGSSKASIDYTNEGTDVSRGFKTLQTKHTDAICKISNTIKGDKDGVMGYIFDYKVEDDDSVGFSIAALRIAKKDNGKRHVEAYVETYKGIDKETLETGPAFKTISGADATPICKGGWTYTGFGKEIVNETLTEKYLAAQKAAGKENQVEFWIEVVANLGSTVTGRALDAGSYTVNFYTEDPGRTKGNNDTLTYTNPSAIIASAIIPADKTLTAFTTSLPQTEQGFYATVYAGQTLTGEWKFDAIKNEAEEIAE